MTQNRRLGLQNNLLLALAERGASVFGFEDAKEILQANNSATRHILMNLTNKRRLQRIERGRYLLVPERAGPRLHWAEYPWVIVPHLIDRYYVGFWTAMSFWGMTEQIPRTVFVATTKRKRDLEFGGQRFEFVTLSEKKFFGFVEQKTSKNASFYISSREKTIVDGLMHPQYCGGMPEVAKAMWNARREADWQAVLTMAGTIGINAVLKRLGYLLSVLDIEETISERIRERIKRVSYDRLDPTAGGAGAGSSKEYGLTINLTKEELLGWMEH